MQSMATEQRRANWSISGIYDLSIIECNALIPLTSLCLCPYAAQGYQSYLSLCTQYLEQLLARGSSSIFIQLNYFPILLTFKDICSATIFLLTFQF